MTHESSTCFKKKSGQPLMSYMNAVDAEQEAGRLKERYQSDMVPYKCAACDFWHLKHRPKPPPKQKKEPLPRCGYCEGRDGQSKVLYPNWEMAEDRADYLNRTNWFRYGLRVYECPHYPGLHLTSKP